MFPEIPNWFPTLLTAIGGILTGIITGIITYRNQNKQLKNDWEKTQTELRRSGTEEFEAINDGNKALREALMDQIKEAHQENERLRKEQELCEVKISALYRRIRSLEQRLHKNNIVFDDIPEVS